MAGDSGVILKMPGGFYPDASGADALTALISNVNNYAVNLLNLPLSGTNMTLTGPQLFAGVIQFTGSAAGNYTVTLPPTARIIDALHPTIPKDGTYAVPISVQNED